MITGEADNTLGFHGKKVKHEEVKVTFEKVGKVQIGLDSIGFSGFKFSPNHKLTEEQKQIAILRWAIDYAGGQIALIQAEGLPPLEDDEAQPAEIVDFKAYRGRKMEGSSTVKLKEKQVRQE